MQVYCCDSISCFPWNFTTNDYWNKEHQWVGGKDLYCNEMVYSVWPLMLPVSAWKLGVLFLLFVVKQILLSYSCKPICKMYDTVYVLHKFKIILRSFLFSCHLTSTLTSGFYSIPRLQALLSLSHRS